MNRIQREISSGGVIFKKENNKIFVALINRHKESKNRQKIEIWGLPKGKIEKNETPPQTALREVQEETGLRGEIISKIDSIHYWYVSKQQDIKFFKIVTFYLLKYLAGNVNWHDREVDKVEWIPIEKALTRLTYKSERNILIKAQRMIREKG